MVTEKYLLRSEAEWNGRREALGILDQVSGRLRRADVNGHRAADHAEFRRPNSNHHSMGPSTAYTQILIDRARKNSAARSGDSGCSAECSGGGMGFMVARGDKALGSTRLRKS